MKQFTMFMFMASLVVLASCAGQKGAVQKGEISRTLEQTMTGKDYLEAIGIGAADQQLENKTQKMATSRNAAIVAAQYELLSVIKGVNLEGGITVEKALETDSVLATKINAEIKGAEIVKSEWTNDDGCLITLRLPKRRLKDMGLKIRD